MFKHFFVTLTLLLSPLARAGLGPQNVLLVVNSASPNSIALASAYVDARHIPTGNIVYIDLPKQFIESIDVAGAMVGSADFDWSKSASTITTQFADGYHELLLVAIASDPIASQSHLLIPLTFNNHNQRSRQQ